MAVYVPLPQYVRRALCGRPTSQIHAPERLVNDLEVQHLELAADTKAEGNCGPHGFGISLIDEATNNRALRVTARYKRFLTRSKKPQVIIYHLRSVASHWMENNADTVMWDDMLFRTLADITRNEGAYG